MSPNLYKCRACGRQFDNFGDMKRHIVIEHHQKGDITSEEQPAEETSG